MKLPLPKETRDYLENNANRLNGISNLGLLFNKYVQWGDNWGGEEKANKNFRENMVKVSSQMRNMKFITGLITGLKDRRNSILKSLESINWKIISFNMVTDSRLVVGLGGASVIETGLTLHPLYGFPYLPASGLKGLARAYAEIVETFSDKKKKKETLLNIFGSDDKDPKKATEENIQGKVIFMDGLPFSFPKLELDIMNPHYGEYYNGKKPPADYLTPVPITFLTIAPGQEFDFALYSKDEELLKKAEKFLRQGLIQLGFGAKTNVGYGYFKEKIESKHSDKSDPEDKENKVDMLFNKIKGIKSAGEKDRFVKVLNEAKEILDIEDKRLFLKKIKNELSKDFINNAKIKPLISDFEKNL